MFSFFFPRKCIHCNEPCGKESKTDNELKDYLCRNCFRLFDAQLPPGKDDLFLSQKLFDGMPTPPQVLAGFPFIAEQVTQSVVHHAKYADMPKLARIMGKKLALRFHDLDYDILLPIPLHRTRLGERGYNQSEMIAQGISGVIRTAVGERSWLRRTRQTPSQTGLVTIEDRIDNMHGAFALSPQGKQQLEGKTILIVDDVMTTGATMASAAEALLEAKPKKIGILSFSLATDSSLATTLPFPSDLPF
jgi:ComF family protein